MEEVATDFFNEGAANALFLRSRAREAKIGKSRKK
jgi:hypothetical protein